MRKYDPKLIKKLSEKLNKPTKYIVEQISKRAFKDNIAPEAELARWARLLGLSADSYIRKLPSSIHSQVYSRPSFFSNNGGIQPARFRIIRIGKDENKLYNQWWVQIFVLGITASVIAQVLGVLLTNLTGLTKP